MVFDKAAPSRQYRVGSCAVEVIVSERRQVGGENALQRRSGNRQDGQRSGNLTANHFASAAFTATGRSCAIQCPDWTTASVRFAQ